MSLPSFIARGCSHGCYTKAAQSGGPLNDRNRHAPFFLLDRKQRYYSVAIAAQTGLSSPGPWVPGDDTVRAAAFTVLLPEHRSPAQLTLVFARREETQDTIASLPETDGEGESAPPYHLPQSINDEEEVSIVLSGRSSHCTQSPSTSQELKLEAERVPIDIPAEEIPSPRAEMSPPVLPIRQGSVSKVESVSWELTANMEPIIPTTTPPKLGTPGTAQLSKRRITYSVDEVSHHALDRLGVNADILKKEKGMKKLGICDDDITQSEELRRYTGVSRMEPTSKVEFMFGFNDEQLHRERAIKRLGTTEQEIMDDYSRRVSRLGISNSLPVKL